MNTIQDSKAESSPILNQSIPRPLKLNNTNYRHNLESDYTEKIETLAKSFDYASNSEHLFTDDLDYLWPVNREMRIMKAGGSIERAIINNVKAFHQFKETVTV